MTNRPEVTQYREDISRFMVHLTRDDRATDAERGMETVDNFLNILRTRQILALRPHCLHASRVPERYKDRFQVCCFTECPLSQIEHMIGYMAGRQVQLEPFGFVFKREFLMEKPAQPVFYVNSYGDDKSVRDGFDKVFEIAERSKFAGKTWKVLPFLSAMHARYDFGWEKEWRHLGDLPFEYDDIECAVVPEDVALEIKTELADLAITMYSPGWNLERMVEESRKQQRRVRRRASAAPKPNGKPPLARRPIPRPLRESV
jgi:hypothetical protein